VVAAGLGVLDWACPARAAGTKVAAMAKHNHPTKLFMLSPSFAYFDCGIHILHEAKCAATKNFMDVAV